MSPTTRATGAAAGRGRWRTQVAVGGAVGALVRAGVVSLAVASGPGGRDRVAVLALNLVGAAALGWLLGRATRDDRWAARVPLVGTGLLGAVTTFSTLVDQLARTFTAGAGPTAVTLAVVSVVGGVVCASAGWRVGVRGDGPPSGAAAQRGPR